MKDRTVAASTWSAIFVLVAVTTLYLALPQLREPLRVLWLTSYLFGLVIIFIMALLGLIRLVPGATGLVPQVFRFAALVVVLLICAGGLYDVFALGDPGGFIMSGVGLLVLVVMAWNRILWPSKR